MAESASTTRQVTLRPRPLTPDAFAPYGAVLDQRQFVLTSTEFPFFANVVTLRPAGEEITYINRHHDHNQIFATFGDPMIVVVARPELKAEGFDPTWIEAFRTDGKTAIVFHVDTWHLAPRAAGPIPILALNVQATNNHVHTERIELKRDFGYRINLVCE